MEVRIKVRIDGGDDAGATRHDDAWQRQAGAAARRRCGDNGQEDEEKGPIHILCHRSVGVLLRKTLARGLPQ